MAQEQVAPEDRARARLKAEKLWQWDLPAHLLEAKLVRARKQVEQELLQKYIDEEKAKDAASA